MRLAFVLFKYFPFGGLQRDFMRIAETCLTRGHEVDVFCLIWEGEKPATMSVHVAPIKAWSNHRRNQKFHLWLKQQWAKGGFDAVIGFNKMQGLDIYYAADPCFQEKALTQRHPIYRLSGRYQHFYDEEKAVFGGEHCTEILMISEPQKHFFIKHYQTPDARFHLLPPGIARDRQRPADADIIRRQFRKEFNIADPEHVFLSVGSGFKTKGVDRSLQALAALSQTERGAVKLFVIGQDNPAPFQKLAQQLGVSDRVVFLSGRSDIPRFLLGADTLLHPAYNENTGTVLLEALVAGLPVVVTDVCGYAHYVSEAQGGIVLPSPFEQSHYNQVLQNILNMNHRSLAQWQENALRFAASADIYSMPEHAADIIDQIAKRKQRA